MCFSFRGGADIWTSIVGFGNFCSGNLVKLFETRIVSPSFALQIPKICFYETLVPTYQASR